VKVRKLIKFEEAEVQVLLSVGESAWLSEWLKFEHLRRMRARVEAFAVEAFEASAAAAKGTGPKHDVQAVQVGSHEAHVAGRVVSHLKRAKDATAALALIDAALAEVDRD